MVFVFNRWLVWSLHPTLGPSFSVRSDDGNEGWPEGLREEEMLGLEERFWEVKALVWEGAEASLLVPHLP